MKTKSKNAILFLCLFLLFKNYAFAQEDALKQSNIYANIENNYTISIPKTIIINNLTKSGGYKINVEGDITGYDKIIVKPDENVILSSFRKEPVLASVTQENTEWTYEILGKETNGTVFAKDLSAGKWTGFLNFNISMESVAGDIITLENTKNSSSISSDDILFGKSLQIGDYIIEGTATSDATATENDLSEGVSAYVNGVKIVGNGANEKNAFSEGYQNGVKEVLESPESFDLNTNNGRIICDVFGYSIGSNQYSQYDTVGNGAFHTVNRILDGEYVEFVDDGTFRMLKPCKIKILHWISGGTSAGAYYYYYKNEANDSHLLSYDYIPNHYTIKYKEIETYCEEGDMLMFVCKGGARDGKWNAMKIILE